MLAAAGDQGAHGTELWLHPNLMQLLPWSEDSFRSRTRRAVILSGGRRHQRGFGMSMRRTCPSSCLQTLTRRLALSARRMWVKLAQCWPVLWTCLCQPLSSGWGLWRMIRDWLQRSVEADEDTSAVLALYDREDHRLVSVRLQWPLARTDKILLCRIQGCASPAGGQGRDTQRMADTP